MAGVSLPVRMEGPVIVGFGRGSSLLGFPTANIPTEQYDQLLPDFKVGVYYGWATLNGVSINSVSASNKLMRTGTCV
ncbi:hypothetical protein Pelo_18960 [Pelomyxa schiedti]|nr:hypothetical protein Pelo_18960 [Pelomyxa schiedti]